MFVLHFPFVNGMTSANVTVRVTVPLIPAYAFVPRTIGTGSVAANDPEQVVVLKLVGLALFSAQVICVPFNRMVPFFNFSSLYLPFLFGLLDELTFSALPESAMATRDDDGSTPVVGGGSPHLDGTTRRRTPKGSHTPQKADFPEVRSCRVLV